MLENASSVDQPLALTEQLIKLMEMFLFLKAQIFVNIK